MKQNVYLFNKYNLVPKNSNITCIYADYRNYMEQFSECRYLLCHENWFFLNKLCFSKITTIHFYKKFGMLREKKQMISTISDFTEKLALSW